MKRLLTLDIGGEGRHVDAWNLNPRPLRTCGPQRGEPIPRHIYGRADAIPLPDGSVDCIIVENTPLRAAALREIRRVIARHGTIVLRHVQLPFSDRHAAAMGVLPGRLTRRVVRLGERVVQESRFELA